MLQIDHVYEFLYQELFFDFEFHYLKNGVPNVINPAFSDIAIFTNRQDTKIKILFYDQEPFINQISNKYLEMFDWQSRYTKQEIFTMHFNNNLPYNLSSDGLGYDSFLVKHPEYIHKQKVLTTSEISDEVNNYIQNNDSYFSFYYFFHGFAALDWYRGYYALNYSKSVIKDYKYDYVSYNRIINDDRSYRIYWVSKLVELGLLPRGQVSFNVTDNLFDDWRDEVASSTSKLSTAAKQHAECHLTDINKLVIDNAELPGSASADISRDIDALWHVVSETVFYYDKLHLTEKIFKPIVSKQPFMLLAAPGNLKYLRSYGFKTFDGIIDESYDTILDNDARINAVAKELQWYCNLPQEEKSRVIEALTPIVEYNFQHFYGKFRHILAQELLDNAKSLFKNIGHNDSNISYDKIYHVLTN